MANGRALELAGMLEAAFRADTEHSILGSLWSVGDTEWSARLSEDGRSVRAIVRHLATAYHAYYNSAFTDADPSWDRWASIGNSKEGREDLVAWLTEGHEALVAAVLKLEDDDLDTPRPSHWGELVPTRRILLVVIGHGYYHAGEINHLRSVLQGNDRWGYYMDEMPPHPAPAWSRPHPWRT
jgi:uncharacterized damage-inducible protein DinB